MKPNHVIGMIFGYYLSRFDKVAYRRLGFSINKEAHRALGKKLGVPTKSIENWRDEFDPVHDNPRQGWHKREMAPSRRRVLEALDDLSEDELFSILQKAIEFPDGMFAQALIEAVSASDEDTQGRVFGSRGITGRKAEDLFVRFHQNTGKPVSGKLTDRRFDGCGYDFEVTSRRNMAAIEVKGLAGLVGGVSFTEKEWSTACDMEDDYFLVVVKNLIIKPIYRMVQNPVANLESKLQVYTTLSLSHSVTERSLTKVEEDAGEYERES